MTLRSGSREYFYRQLDRLFPGMKEKYQRTYGDQYILNSPHHPRLMRLFHDTCQRHGILHDNAQIFQSLRTWEDKQSADQLSLFEP